MPDRKHRHGTLTDCIARNALEAPLFQAETIVLPTRENGRMKKCACHDDGGACWLRSTTTQQGPPFDTTGLVWAVFRLRGDKPMRLTLYFAVVKSGTAPWRDHCRRKPSPYSQHHRPPSDTRVCRALSLLQPQSRNTCRCSS